MNLPSIWGGRKTTQELSVPVKKKTNTNVAVRQRRDDDMIVVQDRGGITVQVQSKTIMIQGQNQVVDPYMMMRMIRSITQDIGAYKSQDNLYSLYAVNALRKARQEMASDLEKHFRLHWKLNDSGESIFFL